MSTAAVSSSSIYQQLQSYFAQRHSDMQQLGQDLQSGNLTAAEQDYTNIQNLGQQGPMANGDPFINSQRESDFVSIGSALQSGNLSAATQAFDQLESTFATPAPVSTADTAGAASSTSSASGPEIVLNLGNLPSGDQITIGLTNNGNGTEQVNISAANAQGQSAGQVSLNLAQNSNEQIILNLLNSTAAATAQSSGVSVSA